MRAPRTALIASLLLGFSLGLLALAGPAWSHAALIRSAGAGDHGTPLGSHPTQGVGWTSLFPPQVSGLQLCDEFDLTVELTGAGDTSGFQLHVGFDDTLLEFGSAEVGGFLSSTGRDVTVFPPVESDGDLLFSAVANPGSAPLPNGSGDLAVVRLRAIRGGTSPLDLHDVFLVDGSGATVPVTSTDSSAIIDPIPGAACYPTPTPPSPMPTTPSTPTSTATLGPTPTLGTPTATEITPTPSPTRTPASPSPGSASPTAPTATPTPTATASPSREASPPTPGTPDTPGTPPGTPSPTSDTSQTPSATATLGGTEITPTSGATTTGPPVFRLYIPQALTS
jgi:hypothetical protein